MFLATLSCFTVPYNVTFPNEVDESEYSTIIEGLINFCFIADILISFRTTFIDESTQEEVIKEKAIAIQYLKGRFWIDLLASIPFDYLMFLFSSGNTFYLNFFRLLKLFRILRLSKLIAYLNLRNEIKSSLRIIKLMFFLILFLHCLGCSWFFIAQQKEQWIPPLDYVFVKTEIYTESNLLKY